MQLLILHEGEPVPNQKLYETLWPDERSAHPESALKTLVSRFRSQLKTISPALAACVVTEKASYRFAEQLGVSVDYFGIRRILKQLNELQQIRSENTGLFDELLALYVGDLFGDAAV